MIVRYGYIYRVLYRKYRNNDMTDGPGTEPEKLKGNLLGRKKRETLERYYIQQIIPEGIMLSQ